MKIALDALGISEPGGGRTATFNLLFQLLELDQANEYVIFLDAYEPCLEPYAERLRQIVAPVSHRIVVRAWAEATWPALLRRERVQLIHYTKNLTTLVRPCPAVVTVHDLTVLAHPELFPLVDVAYWRTVGRYTLRHVERIIAVSRLTAEDVLQYCHVPSERVETIYEGIDDAFRPAPSAEVDRVRAKYGLPANYLLHVGYIWPKKNLATLARAYVGLVRRGEFDGALVLVGSKYKGRGDTALDEFVTSNPDVGQILLPGPIPQEDLVGMFSGAACFAFPSLHEGFGLVPLEAMACGVPVVASRVGVLEELMGEAAVFLDDPRDHVRLAVCLRELLNDVAKQAHMRAVGKVQASRLSRKEGAQRTLALYRQVGGE